MAGITDSLAALDFDLACSLRLTIFDNEAQKAQAKRIAFEVGKMLTGKGGDDT